MSRKTDDNRPTSVRALGLAAAQPQGELRALVILGEEVKSYRLPSGGVIVVGRSSESEIQIVDTSISRRHALLVCGPRLFIEDLGSTNGTQVHGRRLKPGERVEFTIGDVIELGDAMLVVQQKTPLARPVSFVDGREFESRLRQECSRESSLSALALASLELLQQVDEAIIESAFQPALPAQALITRRSKTSFELLLPGATPSMAESLLLDLERAFGRQRIALRAALACRPRDALEADQLLALVRAQPVDPRVEAPPSAFIMLGERMKALQRLAEKIAPSPVNVLIMGETGAGKEVMARFIHQHSRRPADLFVSINCAAMPETLLESELFGYERGAFSGALRSKPGLLEAAGEGTFLLDEVSEMPLSSQAKLLRVLEERKATRLGGVKPYQVRARFIATSNRDLEEMVRRGAFRQDLFYRLDGVSLVIPPLRERAEEIGPLAEFFAEQMHRQLGRPGRPLLLPEALEWLREQSWPGNVRQLRNTIERAVLLSTDGRIGLELVCRKEQQAVTMPPAAETEEVLDLSAQEDHTREMTPPGAASGGIKEEVKNLEQRRILEALGRTGGNQTEAAKLLGISRRTLVDRLEKYGITRPRKGRSGRG